MGKEMRTLKEIIEILSIHKKEIEKKYKIREIKVFGSYAKNKQKKSSDVDILVDFYEVPDLFKFIEIEEYLENLLGVKVDLVRKPVLRAELKDEILSEAVEI